MTTLNSFLAIETCNITHALKSPKLTDWTLKRTIREDRSSIYEFNCGGPQGFSSKSNDLITDLGFSKMEVPNDPVRDFLEFAGGFLASYNLVRDSLYKDYVCCIIGQVFTDKDLEVVVKGCKDFLLGLYTGYGKGE